jgi:hypothetical protein
MQQITKFDPDFQPIRKKFLNSWPIYLYADPDIAAACSGLPVGQISEGEKFMVMDRKRRAGPGSTSLRGGRSPAYLYLLMSSTAYGWTTYDISRELNV